MGRGGLTGAWMTPTVANRGPDRRLPPLAVNDVHENGHPAERHQYGPALEAEDAPVRVRMEHCAWLAVAGQAAELFCLGGGRRGRKTVVLG